MKTPQEKRAANKTYYEKNKETLLIKQRVYQSKHVNKIKRYKAKMRKVRKQRWLQWFSDQGFSNCEKCGYDKSWAALDFHHTGDKKITISTFTHSHGCTAKNKAILKEELKKCILLCSNCHRELHEAEKEAM